MIPPALIMQTVGGGLPNPKSFESLGWLLLGLSALLFIANQALNFYKKHIKQTIPTGVWVTRQEMILAITEVKTSQAQTKVDLENQIKDVRAYCHDEVHSVKGELEGMSSRAEAGREGIQNRINALMELTHHMRGQMEGMLTASRATAEAAVRAAAAAERAATAAETMGRGRPALPA